MKIEFGQETNGNKGLAEQQKESLYHGCCGYSRNERNSLPPQNREWEVDNSQIWLFHLRRAHGTHRRAGPRNIDRHDAMWRSIQQMNAPVRYVASLNGAVYSLSGRGSGLQSKPTSQFYPPAHLSIFNCL